MPVKVRCPGCEKVLNAPDSARGKAIKCPACETKIRIPAEAGGGGAQKSARPPAKKKVRDDDDFLGKLDLNQAIDHSTRVCARCGTEMDEEVLECPNCGVDPRTGQLSASARRKAAIKGPDPSEYYPGLWKDSWQFLLKNRELVVKSAVLTIVCFIFGLGCLFMVVWCTNPPPKMFWGALMLVSFLVVPGWFWFLSTQIIAATLGKKQVLKRVHVDVFLCVALGIKVNIWSFVFLFPVGLAAGLIGLINPLLGGILVGGAQLLMIPMLPAIMTHMTMPVTWKAWLMPVMLPIFGRTIGPSLYWAVVAFVTALINVAIVAGFQFLAFRSLKGAMVGVGLSAENLTTIQGTLPAEPYGKGMAITLLVVLFLIWMLIWCVNAAWLVFNMRGMGLFAYYFKGDLGLISEVAEKEYVAQQRVKGPGGALVTVRTRQQKIMSGVTAAGALLVTANVLMYLILGYTMVPRSLLVLMRLADPPGAAAPADGAAPPAGDPAAPAEGAAPAVPAEGGAPPAEPAPAP